VQENNAVCVIGDQAAEHLAATASLVLKSRRYKHDRNR